MRRARWWVLGALVASALGCDKEPEPVAPPSVEVAPEAADVAASAPAPECDAAEALPPLPAYARAPREGAAGFHVELIETPRRGECVDARSLLSVGGTRGPLLGALRGEGNERRFALLRALDVAPLGESFFLSAGDAGLSLHDARTMIRRARLYDGPLVAVATSPDHARVAVLTAEGALLVVSRDELALLARADGLPGGGRLRFAPDGAAVVHVADKSLVWLPLEGGAVERRELARPATGVAFFADRPGLLALADGQADASFYDVHEGVYKAARPPKRLRPSSGTLAVAAAAERLYTGDDEGTVHALDGVLSEAPREQFLRGLDDPIASLATGPEGALAAGTRSGQIVFWTDGRERARLDPLVMSILSDDLRLAWVEDDAVAVAFLGELFRFEGPETLLRAPDGVGQIVTQHASARDLVVAVRMGARTVVHSVAGEARPEAETRVLGTLRWADVLDVLEADDGSRLLLGLTSKGVDVAFINPDGALITMGQPAMQLARPVSSERVADGRYALWDQAGSVYEVDVRAKSFERLGSFTPGSGQAVVRHHPKRGYEVLIGGRRQALSP